MGIQLVVDTVRTPDWEHALGSLACHCEAFPICEGKLGLSIPTKAIEEFGELRVTKMLEVLCYFDLWEGMWMESKPR